jgi:hypothetical protein
MLSRRTWFAALLLTAALPLEANQGITMTVSPRQSVAPTNLNVRLRFEPDADNRVLQVVADSGGFYRSSEISLDGERSARSAVVEFRNVPSGQYEVYGVLLDAAGRERGRVHETAFVLGVGTDN